MVRCFVSQALLLQDHIGDRCKGWAMPAREFCGMGSDHMSTGLDAIALLLRCSLDVSAHFMTLTRKHDPW